MMEAEYPSRSGSGSSSACCFCFSINNKNSKSTGVPVPTTRNGKNGGVVDSSSEQAKLWGEKEGMLSDMSTFSVKEQEKRLKKALQDEENLSMEAQRVVHWVTHQSAKIDVSNSSYPHS
ncbi:hypothetical protein PIB30_002235 [Stylosanthes scabra]|uniref:Uncharacterized protein n=1 Tax=Stylosanthes scabra TaxID=79078 RepID=A0ABU6T4P8_9FABA|nr:hypothetical protein [Stylosanthes scabra]